jgi:hypothetical protein
VSPRVSLFHRARYGHEHRSLLSANRLGQYSICYSRCVPEDEWDIYQTDEVAVWIERLRRDDPRAAEKVEAAVDVLSEYGPTLGRPLVDTLTGSRIANLKKLCPRQC